MGARFAISTMRLFETGGAPICAIYEIGSPLFEHITMHLDQRYYPGRTFVIGARNNSKDNIYIHSAI